MVSHSSEGERFFQYLKDSFDTLYAEGTRHCCCCVALRQADLCSLNAVSFRSCDGKTAHQLSTFSLIPYFLLSFLSLSFPLFCFFLLSSPKRRNIPEDDVGWSPLPDCRSSWEDCRLDQVPRLHQEQRAGKLQAPRAGRLQVMRSIARLAPGGRQDRRCCGVHSKAFPPFPLDLDC